MEKNTTENDIYFNKYIKYKEKYEQLKQLRGGLIPTIPSTSTQINDQNDLTHVLPFEYVNAIFYYQTGIVLNKYNLNSSSGKKYMLTNDFTLRDVTVADTFSIRPINDNFYNLGDKQLSIKIPNFRVNFFMCFLQQNGDVFYKLFNHIRDTNNIKQAEILALKNKELLLFEKDNEKKEQFKAIETNIKEKEEQQKEKQKELKLIKQKIDNLSKIIKKADNELTEQERTLKRQNQLTEKEQTQKQELEQAIDRLADELFKKRKERDVLISSYIMPKNKLKQEIDEINFFDNFITSRDFPYVMSINNNKNNVSYVRPSGTVNLLSKYLFANKFAEIISLLYDPRFDGINNVVSKKDIILFDKKRQEKGEATYTDLLNEILKIFGPIDEPNLAQTKQRYINFCDMMKVYDTYTYTPVDEIKKNSSTPDEIISKKISFINDKFNANYKIKLSPSSDIPSNTSNASIQPVVPITPVMPEIISKDVSPFDNHIGVDVKLILMFRKFIKICDTIDPLFESFFDIKPSLIILLSYIGIRINTPTLTIGDISNTMLPINNTNLIFNLFGLNYENPADVTKYDSLFNPNEMNASHNAFVKWNTTFETKDEINIPIIKDGNQSSYKKVEFPDCVESGLLQFIKIISYNATTKSYDINMIPPSAEIDLKNFIQTHLEQVNSQEELSPVVRSAFNDVIENRRDFLSDHPKIYKSTFTYYETPNDSITRKTIRYEIYPDYANYILKKLLGLGSLDELTKYNPSISSVSTPSSNLIQIKYGSVLFKFNIMLQMHLSIKIESQSDKGFISTKTRGVPLPFKKTRAFKFTHRMLLAFFSNNLLILGKDDIISNSKLAEKIKEINDNSNLLYSNSLLAFNKSEFLRNEMSKLSVEINYMRELIFKHLFNNIFFARNNRINKITRIIENFMIWNKMENEYFSDQVYSEISLINYYLKSQYFKLKFFPEILSHAYKNDIAHYINYDKKLLSYISSEGNNILMNMLKQSVEGSSEQIHKLKHMITFIKDFVNINHTNNNGQTLLTMLVLDCLQTLHYASDDTDILSNYKSIISHCIFSGADINYGFGNTAPQVFIFVKIANKNQLIKYDEFTQFMGNFYDINLKNKNNETPLMHWIKTADFYNMESNFILNETNSEYINWKDKDGNNALFIYAQMHKYHIEYSKLINMIKQKTKIHDTTNIIEKLITNRLLNKNAINNDGLNILFYCMSINNIKLLQMLLNMYIGFDINQKCNNLNIVLFSLQHSNVTSKNVIILLGELSKKQITRMFNEFDSEDNSALLLLLKNHYDPTKSYSELNSIIESLQITTINKKNKLGETIIDYAIEKLNRDNIDTLLKKGASVQSLVKRKDHEYYNKPIVYNAIMLRKDDIAALLIEKGALDNYMGRNNEKIIVDIVSRATEFNLKNTIKKLKNKGFITV
jgi:hypothetical protein